MAFTKQNNIFHRTNKLKEKLSNNLLNQKDTKEITELDELIISGMLMVERKIKIILNQYPRSPTLEATILEVSL